MDGKGRRERIWISFKEMGGITSKGGEKKSTTGEKRVFFQKHLEREKKRKRQDKGGKKPENLYSHNHTVGRSCKDRRKKKTTPS